MTSLTILNKKNSWQQKTYSCNVDWLQEFSCNICYEMRNVQFRQHSLTFSYKYKCHKVANVFCAFAIFGAEMLQMVLCSFCSFSILPTRETLQILGTEMLLKLKCNLDNTLSRCICAFLNLLAVFGREILQVVLHSWGCKIISPDAFEWKCYTCLCAIKSSPLNAAFSIRLSNCWTHCWCICATQSHSRSVLVQKCCQCWSAV